MVKSKICTFKLQFWNSMVFMLGYKHKFPSTTLRSTIHWRLFATARCDANPYGDGFWYCFVLAFWPKQSDGQVRWFDLLASNMGRANFPGWCWAEIQQFALVGSSSSLHSEACNALGVGAGYFIYLFRQTHSCPPCNPPS